MRLSWHLVIGAFCALLSNTLIIGLVWRGFGYVSASFIAFIPVLLAGYFLHGYFTYRAKPRLSSFALYVASILGNYPLWFAALYLLMDIEGLPIELAAPMTTFLLFVWSYISAGWAFSKFQFHHRN